MFLDESFDFVYNHNGFFIVANNDTPQNSVADINGEQMWLKIVEYVRELMIFAECMLKWWKQELIPNPGNKRRNLYAPDYLGHISWLLTDACSGLDQSNSKKRIIL